jgi:hypothetical protein
MHHHFYTHHWAMDGDYIVFASFGPDGEITEHARWLIPGSQIED